MSTEYTRSLLSSLSERAQQKEKEHKKYLRRLKDKNPKKLDETFARIHAEVFADIDCLACGNCCRSIPPKWLDRDIVKAAKIMSMHPKTFKLRYLETDEDEDLVCRETPCPFLDADNYCFIYEDRPKSCREYPHTDSKNMRGLLTVTRKNIAVCPGVFEIVEKLRDEYPL